MAQVGKCLTGLFRHMLDDKGRLTIPSGWRYAHAEESDFLSATGSASFIAFLVRQAGPYRASDLFKTREGGATTGRGLLEYEVQHLLPKPWAIASSHESGNQPCTR
jgi:hypothetical protein